LPLRQYLEHLYFKRFGKERPDVVLSIEAKARRKKEKKAQRCEAKLQRGQAETAEQKETEAGHP